MPPKNSGGSTKFPGEHKVIHRTAQTAFVRVVTPRKTRSDLREQALLYNLAGGLPSQSLTVVLWRERSKQDGGCFQFECVPSRDQKRPSLRRERVFRERLAAQC